MAEPVPRVCSGGVRWARGDPPREGERGGGHQYAAESSPPPTHCFLLSEWRVGTTTAHRGDDVVVMSSRWWCHRDDRKSDTSAALTCRDVLTCVDLWSSDWGHTSTLCRLPLSLSLPLSRPLSLSPCLSRPLSLSLSLFLFLYRGLGGLPRPLPLSKVTVCSPTTKNMRCWLNVLYT